MTITIIILVLLFIPILTMTLSSDNSIIDDWNLRPKVISGEYGKYERYLNSSNRKGGNNSNRESTIRNLNIDFNNTKTFNNIRDMSSISENLEIKYANNTWFVKDIDLSVRYLKVYWRNSGERILKNEKQKEWLEEFNICFMLMDASAMVAHMKDIIECFEFSINATNQYQNWYSEIGKYQEELPLKIIENLNDITMYLTIQTRINPYNGLPQIPYTLMIKFRTENQKLCVK